MCHVPEERMMLPSEQPGSRNFACPEAARADRGIGMAAWAPGPRYSLPAPSKLSAGLEALWPENPSP